VKPFAFVSTTTPLIFLVFRVVLDEPVPGDETARTEDPADPADPAALATPVPAHVAAISAVAAIPAGAHHRLRITYSRCDERSRTYPEHVARGRSVQGGNQDPG
jgi:hypothetical protein